MYAYTIEGLGIRASNQIQLEFLPTPYMEMVGILPRYNTHEMSAIYNIRYLTRYMSATINVRYLTRYNANYNQCQVSYLGTIP